MVIMKKIISIGLWIVGGLMVLIALVSGGASILSLLERVQHGPGLLFADVEFLGFIAVIAAYIGRSHVIRCQEIVYLRETVGADLAALLFKSPTGAWLRVCVISGSCLLWGWFLTNLGRRGYLPLPDKD
jgi:hypothetical protein